jgi:hypothetical protein
LQFGIVSLGGTVIWVTAAIATLRAAAWRQFRWLTIGGGALFVLLFASAGKGYYLGSWYLPLVGVGAAVIERGWTRRATTVVFVLVVVSGLVTLPLFTPVLSERAVVDSGITDVNDDLGAMLGWEHVVDEVADQYDALTPTERSSATILTGSYSQAGAIDLYGDAHALPNAISGHNSYWWWGRDHHGMGPVIAVGIPPSFLQRYWKDVQRVATLGDDGTPIDPEQDGTVVYVARDQRVPWSEIWPAARHYN